MPESGTHYRSQFNSGGFLVSYLYQYYVSVKIRKCYALLYCANVSSERVIPLFNKHSMIALYHRTGPGTKLSLITGIRVVALFLLSQKASQQIEKFR